MKTVLCHGVFDLFHFGHLEHLRRARALGDRLVVSVVADRFITKRLPVYSQKERVAILEACRYVDRVTLCYAPGPEEIISTLRPDIYCRGAEYKDKEMPESIILAALEIPVFTTPPCPPHTTDIIAKIQLL